MGKVLGRIFWLLVILIMGLWTFEFYNVRNGKEPLFCFKTVEHVYDDGITTISYGLGYKVTNYNRTDLEGTEFDFILAKERTNPGSVRVDNDEGIIEVGNE